MRYVRQEQLSQIYRKNKDKMYKEYNEETFENKELASETVSDCKFIACKFKKCNLTGLKLNGCDFIECHFTDCYISIDDIKSSEAKYCEFDHTRLFSVNWSLLLAGGISEPIYRLTDCVLKYNQFSEMNFKKFSFAGNDILSSMFAECSMTEADFSGCNLEETEFFKCDLRKSDFRGAKGYLVDVLSSKVSGAHFSMPEATNLLRSLQIKVEW